MTTSSASGPVRRRAWPAITFATLVAALTLAAIWWLAVPRGTVCPAIHPAPAGCLTANREVAAVLWTAVVALLYVGTVVVARTVGRRRRVLTLMMAGALVVVSMVAYNAVLVALGSGALSFG